MKVQHSKIGASSYHRWKECPGSVKLCQDIPPSTSSYAEEGTMAHEVAAHVLTQGFFPHNVSVEVIEAVKIYTDAVKEAHYGKPGKLWVEHRFDLSSIHPGLFGTADAVVYQEGEKLLKVFDYKHGAGVPVDVKDNVQLLYYGLGALLTTGVKAKEVELVIVQPRCPHPDGLVRTWRFDSILLLDFAADLSEDAKKTEEPNAPLKSGEHCRFCPAAAVCPEIHSKALIHAKEEFRNDLSYSAEKLAQTLHWLPVLEGWIKSVREFAYGEALHGRNPPGFKLVKKRATRQWLDEKKAENFLRKTKLKISDIFSEPSLISPTQAEKLLAKEDKIKLQKLIEAKSSGFVLAPESDKRPAAKVDPKSEFNVIEVESTSFID